MRRSRLCLGVSALSLLLLLGVPRPLAGQSLRPLPPERRWEEQFNRRRPLSGTLVPGIMTGDQKAFVVPDSITLRLPRSDAGRVCVSIASQDGLYSARASFLLPPGSPRTVTLSGPSGHRNPLRRYTASKLVISATLGGDCREELATYVIPQWGAGTLEQDHISVYVNSRDYTDVSWRGPDGSIHVARCPESGETYVVYSRVCRIPISALGPRTALTIRQRRGGGTLVYDSVFVGGPR
jgi:hypothetical protein